MPHFLCQAAIKIYCGVGCPRAGWPHLEDPLVGITANEAVTHINLGWNCLKIYSLFHLPVKWPAYSLCVLRVKFLRKNILHIFRQRRGRFFTGIYRAYLGQIFCQLKLFFCFGIKRCDTRGIQDNLIRKRLAGDPEPGALHLPMRVWDYARRGIIYSLLLVASRCK